VAGGEPALGYGEPAVSLADALLGALTLYSSALALRVERAAGGGHALLGDANRVPPPPRTDVMVVSAFGLAPSLLGTFALSGGATALCLGAFARRLEVTGGMAAVNVGVGLGRRAHAGLRLSRADATDRRMIRLRAPTAPLVVSE
jgi:hypothetical protein